MTIKGIRTLKSIALALGASLALHGAAGAQTIKTGVDATFAPADASARALSALRFHTVTSWPRLKKRRAIAAPILPIPTTPIFTHVSFDCGARVAPRNAKLT